MLCLKGQSRLQHESRVFVWIVRLGFSAPDKRMSRVLVGPGILDFITYDVLEKRKKALLLGAK